MEAHLPQAARTRVRDALRARPPSETLKAVERSHPESAKEPHAHECDTGARSANVTCPSSLARTRRDRIHLSGANCTVHTGATGDDMVAANCFAQAARTADDQINGCNSECIWRAHTRTPPEKHSSRDWAPASGLDRG